MLVEENTTTLSRWWEKVQSKKQARSYIRVVLLVGLIVLLAAVGGCAGGVDQPDIVGSDTETTAITETTAAETGTITGRVTDEESGEPLSEVYLAVGWEGIQLTAITDENGRYTVPDVPAGEDAPVFGFHDDGYRYRASSFDDGLDIVLEPEETYTYDFSLTRLNDPQNEPELSNPSLTPETAAPGETVTFGLTASDGAGGLSPEIFAANPQIGKLVLLEPTSGENEYSAELTIPPDTPPGEYTFAFFAASNDCYVNSVFPTLTLTVTG